MSLSRPKSVVWPYWKQDVATLHWVHDHEAVLRGVHGCLRPGRRLLFQMSSGGGGARHESTCAVPEWTHLAAQRTAYDTSRPE